MIKLERFGQILKIPSEGTCIYSNESSINLLNQHCENRTPYKTNIPHFTKIKNNISILNNKQTQSHLDPSITHHNELLPCIINWELIIKENVICVDMHKDLVDACISVMLYNLETCQKFNLAYYIAHKIEDIKECEDCPLPYGLLLTCIYQYVLVKHLKLIQPRYYLNFRVMDSINGQEVRKKDKGKRPKSRSPSPSASAESTNQSSPLLPLNLFPRTLTSSGSRNRTN
ncbi:hypothetical protein Tco_1278835 [Tanacetum coccineum]